VTAYSNDGSAKRAECVEQMRQDLRRAAEFFADNGYARWANTVLNVEQSIEAPETYRRLPW